MAAALILYMTFGVEIDHSHICKVRMKCSLQFNNYKLSEVMSDKFNADRICTLVASFSPKENTTAILIIIIIIIIINVKGKVPVL
jgi:hypothetical protein